MRNLILIILLVALMGCGISESDVQATIAALPSQTPQSTATHTTTPTPAPTPTNTPNPVGYQLQKLGILSRMVESINTFNDLLRSADITDLEWRAAVEEVLLEFEQHADDLRSRTGYSENNHEFQAWLDLSAEEADNLAMNMRDLMISLDSSKVALVQANLELMAEYATKATELVGSN